MTTQNDTRQDKQESASLADRLPELTEEERGWTQGVTQKAWAYNYLSAGIGYVWTMPDIGISLQVTSDDTMRLLTVVDHKYCLFMVASVAATLEHLGLSLDLSQTIVAPYVEGKNVTGPTTGSSVAEGDGSGVEVV